MIFPFVVSAMLCAYPAERRRYVATNLSGVGVREFVAVFVMNGVLVDVGANSRGITNWPRSLAPHAIITPLFLSANE